MPSLDIPTNTTTRPRDTYAISFSVSDVVSLRAHFKDAPQWKRYFFKILLASHEQVIARLRAASVAERLELLSTEDYMQLEWFNLKKSATNALSPSIIALDGLNLPASLCNRSAFFRAAAKLFLRGEIAEEKEV